jgi:hypothetical protein
MPRTAVGAETLAPGKCCLRLVLQSGLGRGAWIRAESILERQTEFDEDFRRNFSSTLES